MSIEFIARVAGVDDEYCLVGAVAEREDGTGRALMFQAGEEPPDEQDVRLGMDTYCVVTEDHGTAYGCVRELSIDGDRMHVVISDEALADLGLDHGVIQVQLAVPPESVEVLREYLGRILTYGRPDARPAVLRL
jgi:hypothetical protein